MLMCSNTGLYSDWSSSNGVGKMPNSTCELFKSESACSVCSCANKSLLDARDTVICKVALQFPLFETKSTSFHIDLLLCFLIGKISADLFKQLDLICSNAKTIIL